MEKEDCYTNLGVGIKLNFCIFISKKEPEEDNSSQFFYLTGNLVYFPYWKRKSIDCYKIYIQFVNYWIDYSSES